MRPRNTDDGYGTANSFVKWHSPRSANASMNRFAARGHVVLELLHLLRREQQIEDLAVLGVAGRVDTEGDQRPYVAQVHDAFGREALVVLQRALGGVAAGRP